MAAHQNIRTAHSLQERKRTTDVLSSENINVDFASLLLSEPVQKGLTAAGFEKPSPIQLKAIPLGRCGLDLIVQAKSGTGKTCVFSVIALENIITTSSSLQVLVLAPTREIAVQIQNVIQAIGIAMEGLKCHTFIGGTIFGQDRQHLKKCHIAVGTPGRIKQLIEYEVLKTDSVRMFVLDEADKLLDEKFQASVNWIYHQLPENKQMLALSATYPESLAQQLTNYMRDPTFVRLNPRDLTLQGIKQFYKIVPGHQLPHKSFQIKADNLVTLLSQIAFNQCLIFSNFQSRAHNLCELLLEKGWPATYISGNQEQADRMKAMAELKAYKCRILISTDLTSRGIDAENVNLIINLDVPMDFKTYLHRIGRAGRFGTHGAAVTLASEGQEVNLLQTVKKKSGSDIRLLPDPVPSNLLEMTAAQIQTKVAESTDVIGSADNEVFVEKGTSQMEGDGDSEQSYSLREVTKQQNNCLQTMKDGAVDGEVNGGMPRNRLSLAEDKFQMSSEKQIFVSLGGGDANASNRVKKLLEKETSEKPVVDIQRDRLGMLSEGQGDQFQARRRTRHRWMIDLEEWMLPIMVMQEVRKTERKRWTWEDAFKEFENKRRLCKGDIKSVEAKLCHQSGNSPCWDESKRQNLPEDGLEGLGAAAGFGKDLNVDAFSKGNEFPELLESGDKCSAENTERMLKNSDVYVEFQAMKALLKQCRVENATLEGAEDIKRSQFRSSSDEVKSQQRTLSDFKKTGEDLRHENLPCRDKTLEKDSMSEEVCRDFRLDMQGQKESFEAGGDGEHVQEKYEQNSGIGLNRGVTSSGDILQETCNVDDISSLERSCPSVIQVIKSTDSDGEERLTDHHPCEMKLNCKEKKMENASKEDHNFVTSGTFSNGNFKENLPCSNFGQSSHGAAKHVSGNDNRSINHTSDKIWEYFKQYVKEESTEGLSSRKLGRADERIADNASSESLESDSASPSPLSSSERTSESEQNLIDSKMSDLSTESGKLNGRDSSPRCDKEKKFHRKGKANNILKEQHYNWDASYSYYPYYNGTEWNEGADGYEGGLHYGDWDNYVYPSHYTGWGAGWGAGYGGGAHPHRYWDAYFY